MTAAKLDAPLNRPLRGASFGQAVQRGFKNYASFHGRASRSEFWWWYLFMVAVNVVFAIIGLLAGGPTAMDMSGEMAAPSAGYSIVTGLQGLWGLATLLPTLGLGIRRLHDANSSGWMILLGLIPFVGAIILIVLYVREQNPAGARFDR